MNFQRYNLSNIENKYQKASTYLGKKIKLIALKISIVLAIFISVLIFAFGLGTIKGLIANAPRIDNVEISPQSFLSTIYDSEGNEIQRLVQQGSNRIFVPIEKIPKHVQDAFIAIEDSRFRQHHGIDLKGIFRALVLGFKSGGLTQGASTITQQLIKNAIFNGGNESNMLLKIKRKIQEQYLAVEIEKRHNKDKILESYLNTINLGYNSLGIQTAAKRYFDKDVSDLTISEGAVLACIPQNPSLLNPISGQKRNAQKIKVVLGNMLKYGYIDKKQHDEALKDNVYSRIHKENTDANIYDYSYFTDSLIYEIIDDMMQKLGYSKKEAYNKLFSGGLKIYSTQDTKAQKIATDILNSDFLPTNGYTMTYRLTVQDKNGELKNYSDMNITNRLRKIKKNNEYNILVNDKDQANTLIDDFKKTLKDVKVIGEKLILHPQPQMSFTMMDSHTGEVRSIVGGRGEKDGALTQNRATGLFRQPGSTIKPILDYGPAFDLGYLSQNSTILDEPYSYPDGTKVNTPWGHHFGNVSMTKALCYSLNVPAIKALALVKPEVAIEYLRRMNFNHILYEPNENGYSDVNLSSALGGFTYGVSNLQMTAAYSSLANGGMFIKPRLYTKIIDSNGELLLDNTQETRQIYSRSTATQLTNILSQLPRIYIQGNYGEPFNTSTTEIAAKTGTTNDYMDSWFCGYSNYYTASIWNGYDNFDSPVQDRWQFRAWNKIMTEIHKGLKYRKIYENN